MHSFNSEQANTVIRCCTHLLSVNLDPDTLHANLRLCLRLTRQPELAAVFTKDGGPQALLALTHKSSFRGFTSLAALLVRHCLEEGPLLKQAMESVIRSVVTNPSGGSKEIRVQGMGNRELHYVLRRLGPCACRDPELFTETACSILRVNNQPPKPESYLVSQRIPPTSLKCASPAKMEPVVLNLNQRNLINLLIDHLCSDAFFEETSEKSEGGEGMKVEEEAVRESSLSALFRRRRQARHGSYRRQLAGNYDIDDDVVSEDMNIDRMDSEPASEAGGTTQADQTGSTEGSGSNKNDKLTEKPLLSKAAILRLLAELVDSYPSCAKLITESVRKIKIDGQPAKVRECSCCEWILQEQSMVPLSLYASHL